MGEFDSEDRFLEELTHRIRPANRSRNKRSLATKERKHQEKCFDRKSENDVGLNDSQRVPTEVNCFGDLVQVVFH